MVSKGNHPQMALIQVSEILWFTQICGFVWKKNISLNPVVNQHFPMTYDMNNSHKSGFRPPFLDTPGGHDINGGGEF